MPPPLGAGRSGLPSLKAPKITGTGPSYGGQQVPSSKAGQSSLKAKKQTKLGGRSQSKGRDSSERGQAQADSKAYETLSRMRTTGMNSDITGYTGFKGDEGKKVTFEKDLLQENLHPSISNVGAGLKNSATKPFFGKESIRPFQSTVNALSLGGGVGGP